MKYKVLPVVYAASENFKSTIRFVLELVDEIDADALAYAAGQVQRRYPYFSVRVEREGEAYVLAENDLPFVLTKENRAICLGSAESNYHLLAFAYDKDIISIDISHLICDGNGVAPMVKTLTYYYIQKRYGDAGIDTSVIRLVTDEIPEEEYLYPFPDEPLPVNGEIVPAEEPPEAFQFDADYFDRDGIYAYHLQVPQKDLVARAKEDNGSPLSWVCVKLFEVVNRLFPENKKEIVFLIPHDYRAVLGTPLSHDSLVRVMCTGLPRECRDFPAKELNPMLRGQIVRACDESLDVLMINWVIGLNAQLAPLTLVEKRRTMQEIMGGLFGPCSIGISYTGNIAWGGMEKYIKDVHAYAGEENMFGQLSVQIFTCGPYFSLTLMQPGKNPAITSELIKSFEESGIKCTFMSEGRFQYPDFVLPEW